MRESESNGEVGRGHDRRVPFAFHMAVEFARGLGETIKDYPIASAAVFLGQTVALGIEVHAAQIGTYFDLKDVAALHMLALYLAGVGGTVGELAFRVVRFGARVERAWKDGSLPDSPTIGDIRDAGSAKK